MAVQARGMESRGGQAPDLTGTRPSRQLSVTRSAVLSQPEEEAVQSECREDKHRNRRTGGKGLEKYTGTDSLRDKHRDRQSLGAAAEKHSREQQTLWIKMEDKEEKQTCKETAGTSNCQCWRKRIRGELRIWHAGMKLVLPQQKALNKVLWRKRRVGTVCEKVSEKRDESQGRYAWNMQPEATGRHRNQRDWLNKCLRAIRWLTRWAWEELCEGCDMEEWCKDWQSERRRAEVSRRVRTGQWVRSQQWGRGRSGAGWRRQGRKPHFGTMSTRKHIPLRSLVGHGNFTPTPALSKYLRVPLQKNTSSPVLLIHMEEYKYCQSFPEIL